MLRHLLPHRAAATTLALALLAAPAAAHAQATDAGTGSGLGLPNREQLEAASFDVLPTADSAHQVLAQHFLSALVLMEENLGFSDLEPARVSLTGNSAQWTQWRLEGLNLSDPLFDGAAAFHVPWSMVSSLGVLNGESARTSLPGAIHFEVSPVPGRATAGVAGAVTAGGAGGAFPLAPAIDAAFTGAHPSQREVPPDPDRERLIGRGRLQGFQTSKIRADLTLRLAVDLELQRRHLLSFASGDARLNATHYDERGERATALAELAPGDRRWRAYLLAELLHRDHLHAEQGFTLPETQDLTSGGFLAGFVGQHVRAGLTWKRFVTRAYDRDFARELNDVDGEGRFPFVPAGMMNTARLELAARGAGFYVNGDLRVLDWAPDGTSQHALTWLGAPYGTMTVRSRPTSTWVGEHRAGWARTFDLGTFEVAVDGALTVAHAQAAGLSLALPGGAVKADLIARLRPAFEPFLAVGWVPVGLSSQLALALTPGTFQASQALVGGREIQRYGGEYTRVDPALRTASIGAAAIGFRSRFATTWRASFQGIIKIWDGVPRFELDGPPERYGHFTNGAFFFDDPRTRYLLASTPRELTPFGGTLQAQLSRVNDGEWFFNASLAASSFFGSPPPGSGPWANDIGIVDWNGANPNAARNAFASTDGDRAWVARLGGAYRFWRTLWGSVLVAFRDGQPFSLYQSAMENGQLATWQARLRGSPLRVDRPLLGWREDFQCVVDVQVSYDVRLDAARTLRLKLIAANLFDLDNETAERGTPGPDGLGRSSLTTQLPRTLAFGLELLETPAP